VTHVVVPLEHLQPQSTTSFARDARTKGLGIVPYEQLLEALNVLDGLRPPKKAITVPPASAAASASPRHPIDSPPITGPSDSKSFTLAVSATSARTLSFGKMTPTNGLEAPNPLTNKCGLTPFSPSLVLLVPVVEKILPAEGPAQGNFSVALFGKNFQSGAGFKIRLHNALTDRSVFLVDYEFHGATVVGQVPAENLDSGVWSISATNNFTSGQAHWSAVTASTSLKVNEPLALQLQRLSSEKDRQQSITILESTLFTVHQVLTSIQGMEANLRLQLAALTQADQPSRKALTNGDSEVDVQSADNSDDAEDHMSEADRAGIHRVILELRDGEQFLPLLSSGTKLCMNIHFCQLLTRRIPRQERSRSSSASATTSMAALMAASRPLLTSSSLKTAKSRSLSVRRSQTCKKRGI